MSQQPRKRQRENVPPAANKTKARVALPKLHYFCEHPQDLFRALFHDEARQNAARSAGMLYTSAVGDKYVDFERLVWNEMKQHKRFNLTPDTLKLHVPNLKDLDTNTYNEMWKQYKRHCDYENLARMQSKALTDMVATLGKQLETAQDEKTHLATTATLTEQTAQAQVVQLVEQRAQAKKQHALELQSVAQSTGKQIAATEKQLETEIAAKAQLSKDNTKLREHSKQLELQLQSQAAALAEKEQEVLDLQTTLDVHKENMQTGMEFERQESSNAVTTLKNKNESLQDEMAVEKAKLKLKVENANTIYEENIVLEKQLKARMEKTSELKEENTFLKAQMRMAAMGGEEGMGAFNGMARSAMNWRSDVANHMKAAGVKQDQNTQGKMPLAPANTDSAKISPFQKLMSMIKD